MPHRFNGNIVNVPQLLQHIGYDLPSRGSPLAHLRVWFRGQASKDWELQPGVYRSTFPARDEKERLLLERNLTQDFRVESAGILTKEANEGELYFIQQHYRMPTRLLDWTLSPLAALYFAVREHDSTDGALFMMDAFGLAVTQKATGFRGVATGRHPMFAQSVRIISEAEDAKFPDYVFPVRPDHFDKRMMRQKSGFTFHVPNHGTLTQTENYTLLAYEIPAEKKRDLLRELFLLGVDEFSVFGDLDSLSRRLKDAYGIK